jgi:hypothetical protein
LEGTEDDGGEDAPVLAVVSATRYSDQFAFIGFFIVTPSRRGQGLGRQIWDAAMKRVEDVGVVGLDGVLEQVPRYEAAGFVVAHHTTRHGGTVTIDAPSDPRLKVVGDGSPLVDKIVGYDSACFPAPRAAFVRFWVAASHTVALVDDETGALLAWGTIRACRSGWKIGPLFAETAAGADLVFTSLAAHAGPAAEVFLDTPLPNDAAVALATSHGLSPTFTCARMYRCTAQQEAPSLPLSRTFGLTSFELG